MCKDVTSALKVMEQNHSAYLSCIASILEFGIDQLNIFLSNDNHVQSAEGRRQNGLHDALTGSNFNIADVS